MGLCVVLLAVYQFIALVDMTEASPPKDDGSIIITRVKGTTIICNKGKEHGIAVGMLFNMTRDGHNYGKAEVLIVKETISGLKVRQIESGYRPRVQDKLERYLPVEKSKKKSVQNGGFQPWHIAKGEIKPYLLGSIGLIVSDVDIGVSFILGC